MDGDVQRAIFLLLRRFLEGFYKPAGPQHVQQRRLIIIFLIVALGIVLVSLPLSLEGTTRLIFVFFIGLLLLALALALQNRLWFGRVVMPLAGFLLITWFVYSGGIHDDGIGGYYFLLITVALLFNRRILILTGLMSTLAVIVIGLEETSGAITTHFGPLTERPTILTTALFLMATTLALYFLVTRLQQAVEEARGNELAQIDSNRELRGLQAELEQRVATRTAELDFANQQLIKQLERINSLQAKLREESVRDPLTGLFNRRHLDEMLKLELARAGRANLPITLMLVDIDHFKNVNDKHGHPAGDEVLKWVSRMLIKSVRGGDIVCRYGGEEFLIVLPGMQLRDAKVRAEKIRSKLESLEFPLNEQSVKVTVSVGGAVYPENGNSPEMLVSAADLALYQAKQNGRNRVEF